MTKSKVILAMALIVAGSLVAAAVVGAFAGGIAGYLVARWEGRGLSLIPFPEAQGEMPFPELLSVPHLRIILKVEEPVEGALVTKVEPESPAEEAGIEVGDIITAVDGVKVDEAHPLRDLILEYGPGEKITLTLSHRGQSREVQATLGETTDEEGETIPYFGVRYWSMKPRFFQPQRFDLSRSQDAPLNLLLRRSLGRIRLCFSNL